MATSSPLMGASAAYHDALYAQYKSDPSSVDESWRLVFQVLDEVDVGYPARSNGESGSASAPLAERIRSRGHLDARLNPLATDHASEPFTAAPEFDGLKALYCEGLTLETAHIDDVVVRERCRLLFEGRPSLPDAGARRRAFDLLLRSEEFERVIGIRYPTKKRFGAEGAEAIVPLLDRLLHQAAAAGFQDVVIGTMHRGRLTLTANVLQKPLDRLFEEIVGAHPLPDLSQPADVPYHLGYEGEIELSGRRLQISLMANPSHLEAVNPVTIGRARARQDRSGRPEDVLCILLHTDASVIGQGSVAETLQLSGVAGFTVGGTIHLIINNQIGFTTNPDEARSSRYCTGLWKAVDSPILHVNGDKVDDVVLAGELAVAFRTEHKRDVVVDLVCYRRNGHNEIDEPRFTQPVEYVAIEAHESVVRQYARALEQSSALKSDEEQDARAAHSARFGAALAAAKDAVSAGSGMTASTVTRTGDSEPETGVDLEQARAALRALASIPDGLEVDRKLAQLVERRSGAIEAGVPWALGEALAFASLLREGTPVRLTGQDVVRGAFSHRHFALTDMRSGERHISLNHLSHNQARFDIVNSPLSEYAVLGFEYGYSVERPEALTIWEAQFGDFANGAQIVIDQFVASGEAKWGQRSSLVILLPHGLEGQGPEHSSARPERFLQLAAEHNFELVHPSTPANYFHLLRRQAKRDRRVPLVVLSPKTLLRLPAALSPLDAFQTGTGFRPVIATQGDTTDKVLICSGKIAYELEAARAARNDWSTAIVRLERLYPLADEELLALFRSWRNAQFAWVQEEPRNYGAWQHLDRRLEALLERAGARHPHVSCIARAEQSSPAGSFHGRHEAEQQALVAQAFAIFREGATVTPIKGATR
jgi:2-oxoglutarate dehydrogenase E1 component